MTQVLDFNHKSASLQLVVWCDEHAALTALYSTERKKGHATFLLEQTTWYADRHGLTITLEVGEFGAGERLSNDQLIKLYEKFGFTVTKNESTWIFMERQPL